MTPQSAVIESFNYRLRDELLNETLFRSPDHAPRGACFLEGRQHRPQHSAIGGLFDGLFGSATDTSSVEIGVEMRPLIDYM